MMKEYLSAWFSGNAAAAYEAGVAEEVPEIPVHMLSDYPYAVMVRAERTLEGMTLTVMITIASDAPWCCYGSDLITNGKVDALIYSNSRWEDCPAVQSPVVFAGMTDADVIISSSHDIYYAENADETAGTYTVTDELYFAANYEDVVYRFKRSTIRGLADEARRLGNVENALSVAQMKEIFMNVPSDTRLFLPRAETGAF